jgi:hypothetical protein
MWPTTRPRPRDTPPFIKVTINLQHTILKVQGLTRECSCMRCSSRVITERCNDGIHRAFPFLPTRSSLSTIIRPHTFSDTGKSDDTPNCCRIRIVRSQRPGKTRYISRNDPRQHPGMLPAEFDLEESGICVVDNLLGCSCKLV